MTARAPSSIELQEAKRIVEALLFATNEPISLHKMHEIIESAIPIKAKEIKKILEELEKEYSAQNRSFRLHAIADGFALRTHASYAPYVQLLFSSRKKEKLSHASMEALAIVAYKQPITKVEIERIRGVDCSGVLQLLTDRGLIEISGKLEVPGRPSLFSTTKDFLKYFGLKNLEELPTFSQNSY